MCSDCRALAMRVLRTYQKMHATGSSFGCLFVLTTNLNLPQPSSWHVRFQQGMEVFSISPRPREARCRLSLLRLVPTVLVALYITL